MKEVKNHQQTLCWRCRNALKKCPWSIRFEPVEGWDAVSTRLQTASNASCRDSFLVKACPMFEAETPRKPIHKPTTKRKPSLPKRWTAKETSKAIALAEKGTPYKEIAAVLGRTACSVYAKFKYLRGTDKIKTGGKLN